jgi:hypothetical protein
MRSMVEGASAKEYKPPSTALLAVPLPRAPARGRITSLPGRKRSQESRPRAARIALA